MGVIRSSLLLSLLTAASLSAQGAPTETGTVVGSVVDTLGKAVRGAEVWIAAWSSEERLVSGKTSNGGMFALRGVPVGKSLLAWATAPGMTRVYARVNVRPATKRDTAYIRLWDAGTIKGVVRDEAGAPVAGAVVCAAFDSARGYGFEPQAEGVTGADGRFELVKVPLGDITVRATLSGFALVEKSVYLRDSSETEIVLKERGGVRMAVRVRGLAGDAAKGLGVRLLPYARGSHQVLPRRLVRGKTGEDGSWTVAGLPDFDYTVSVSGKGMSFAPRNVRVKAGDGPHELTFTAHRDDAVVLRGRVLDPDGEPLRGAGILCRASNGGRRSAAVTDDGGRFELKSPLSPGTACVFYLTTTSLVLVQPAGVDPRRFPVRRPDYRLRTVVRTDQPYEFKTVAGATVRGRAVAADGHPLRFQRVRLAHARRNTTPRWGTFAYATTDRRGSFEFRRVPLTEDPVRVESSGRGGAGHTEAFGLKPGAVIDDVEVVCAAPANVAGVVLDEDGEPLPGARVWLRDYDLATGRQRNGSVAEVYTDRQGRFCHLAVAPGGHKLQVYVVGYGSSVPLEEGGEIFEVKPGAECERRLRIR